MGNNEKNLSAGAGIAIYISFFIGWLIVGGLFTFAPLLSNGVAQLAGKGAIQGAFIAWLSIFITFGIKLSKNNKYSKILLFTNIIIWIGLTAWIWYKIGP